MVCCDNVQIYVCVLLYILRGTVKVAKVPIFIDNEFVNVEVVYFAALYSIFIKVSSSRTSKLCGRE